MIYDIVQLFFRRIDDSEFRKTRLLPIRDYHLPIIHTRVHCSVSNLIVRKKRVKEIKRKA